MPVQTVILAIIIILVLYALFTIGFPFLLAYLLALLLEPFVLFLSKKLKMNRVYASLIICTLFTCILIGLGYLLVYKVATEVIALSSALLSSFQEINQGIGVLGESYQHFLQTMPLEYQADIRQFAGTLLESLTQLIEPVMAVFFNLAKKVPNFFLEFVITFIALFFISMNLPQNKQYFLHLFDQQARPRVETVMKSLQQAVFGFLRAQIIISCCIFIFLLIGFLILGIKYPSAIALLITVVDILPILGTGSILIPMSVYQLFTGDIFLGLALLILYVLVILLRRIIEPKILADAIGLSPLSVLISMYVGVVTTGFIGLFLGPAVLIVFQALKKVGIIDLKIKL